MNQLSSYEQYSAFMGDIDNAWDCEHCPLSVNGEFNSCAKEECEVLTMCQLSIEDVEGV